VLCVKAIQAGVGCEQEIKKKGRWAERDLAGEGGFGF
jgi:hypothetical protein